MIDIGSWMDSFCQKLRTIFGQRLVFVGLQGSYGRGEATKNSDIDVVVILDELTMSDLQTYDAMLCELPYRELVCGFLSGKTELMDWEPSDLFQFYYDTTPIWGNVDELLTRIHPDTVKRAVRIGACNIYHACVHNILHEKDPAIIKALYKSASFIVQAIGYLETGTYIRQTTPLLQQLGNAEKAILTVYMNLKAGKDISPDEFFPLSEQLFRWSKDLIVQYAESDV